MTTYNFRDVLDEKLQLSNTTLDNFLKNVKRNISVEQKSRLSLSPDKPFCFMTSNKIALSRYAIESLLNKGGIDEIREETLIDLFKQIDVQTNFKKTKYYNFLKKSYIRNTKIKQEFVCYAIWFLFRNQNATIEDFHYHVQSLSQFSKDTHLVIETDLKNFKGFSSNYNYSYIIDAYSTAKTILLNKNKMKLNANLKSLYIGEENSCQNFKEIPFKKISKNRDGNYYASADKLTVADIYIWDEDEKFRKLQNIFSSDEITHELYRNGINSAVGTGTLIPISLKKLSKNIINENNFTTNKFQLVGSTQVAGRGTADIQDPFMRTLEYLFSVESKETFRRELESRIEIQYSSTKLNLNSSFSEIPFDVIFINPITSTSKAIIGDPSKQINLPKERYTIQLKDGNIIIIPKLSNSPTGIGTMSRLRITKDILSEFPVEKYKNRISTYRQQAFLDTYGNRNIPLTLKSKSPLTKKDYSDFFGKDKNTAIEFATKYIKKLLSDSYISSDLPPNIKTQLKRLTIALGTVYLKSAINDLSEKISQIEYIYFLVANENKVKAWIKSGFIMSVYSAVSARGKIIVNLSNNDIQTFKANNLRGRNAIKSQTRNLLNPLYYKIGV